MTLKNITLTLKKDKRVLIRNLNFSLRPGDRTALIGDEGNGKSSLLKAIYNPSLVEDYLLVEGDIDTRGEILAYLPQEMENTELDFPRYLDSLGAVFSYRAFYQLLDQMALDEEFLHSRRSFSTLSGGEKVKWLLLGLLMKQPTVLLLDEPSNDLDLQSLTWLENFLLTLKIPVLFISHDELLLERCAKKVIHMELRRRRTEPVHTVSSLSYREYVQEHRRRVDVQNQLARKERAEEKMRQERYRELFEKVAARQSSISRKDPQGAAKLKKKMHSIKSMEKRFEREREEMTPFVHLDEEIFVRFSPEIHVPTRKIVLDYALEKLQTENRILSRDVALKIVGPAKVVLIGANGSGKSTLLRQIYHYLLSERIPCSYMPQNYQEFFGERETVLSFLSMTGTKEENTTIRTYLGSLGYTAEEMNSLVTQLSGGQKAKLYFARMQLEKKPLLLLDEPTRNFSPLSGPVIRESLRSFGGAILAVSHDRKFIAEVADEVYELRRDGLFRVGMGAAL